MLQLIRDNMQSFFAWVIIGFLVILMALFGVDAFFTAPTNKGVLEINGEPVSNAELQQAIQMQKQRLRSMMGENVNPAMLDDEVLKEPALESLIQRRLMLQASAENRITASGALLASSITNDQTFFVDGKFSQQRYETVLAQSGYTHARYLEALQADTVLRQLIQGIAGSSFVTSEEVKQQAALLNEKRSGEYIRFPLAEKIASIKVSDQEIEAYFQANKDKFMTQEQVSVNYIHITPEDFFAEVTDEQVLQQYELELKDLDRRDEKRVSHILIESDSETVPEKLLSVKQQLEQGADFAELAKSESQDIASALMGGDLGVTRGDTFPEAFENALANLKPNMISEPVKTDSGWHLIKLVSVSPFSVPSFDENRERIEYDLKMVSAQSVFPAKVEQLADLSFNASDLAEPAKTIGVSVKSSGIFSREDAARLGTPFNEPSVVRAAFSNEVLVDGNNSELIELADGSALVLRVTSHENSRLKELATVRQDIETKLKQDKAAEQLRQDVASKLKGIEPSAQLASIAQFSGSKIEKLDQLGRNQFVPDRKLVSALFSANTQQGVQQIVLSNGDIAVYRLTKIIPGALDEAQELDRRLGQLQSNDEFSRYQKALELNAEIVHHES